MAALLTALHWARIPHRVLSVSWVLPHVWKVSCNGARQKLCSAATRRRSMSDLSVTGGCAYASQAFVGLSFQSTEPETLNPGPRMPPRWMAGNHCGAGWLKRTNVTCFFISSSSTAATPARSASAEASACVQTRQS